MNNASDVLKYSVVLMFFMGFVVAVSGQWRMNPVDEPFSLNKTGVNTTAIQLVSLEYQDSETGSWEPVKPSLLSETDLDNINYYYNGTDGNASSLDHLYDKFWFADFRSNATLGGEIKYNATGTVQLDNQTDVSSEGPANVTEVLDVGDYKIEVLNEIKDNYKAGKQITVEAAAKDPDTGIYVDGTDDGSGNMYVTIANNEASINNSVQSYEPDGNYFYDDRIDIPEETNSTFTFNIEIMDSGSHGTYSEIIHTYPAIEGELNEFSSSGGCDESSMVENCEEGADISFEYEVTASSANYVNLTMNKFNESGRTEVENMTLNQDSSNVFSDTVEMPDINTSAFESKIEFVFNATNNDRYHGDRRNVTLDRFSFDDRSNPNAFQGDTYTLSLFLGKPHSNTPYPPERFQSISVNVTNTTDDVIETFDKSDFEYTTDNLYEADMQIGTDMPNGSYGIEGEATDIYGNSSPVDSGFNVGEVNESFTVSDADFSVNTLWSQTFQIDIENTLNEVNELSIENDLPDEISFQNSSIVLDPEEEDVLEFEVNLSEMEDESGDLTLSDNTTGYEKEIEVTADAADCEHISGRICSLTESPVEVYIDNASESIVTTVEALHIGPVDEEIQVNVSVTGEVSDYIEIEGETENLNVSNALNVDLNYTAEQRGNFSGDIVFETENDNKLELNTTLEADISESSEEDDGISITADPSSLDLGTIPEGDSASETVEITNNGDETLSDVSSSSTQFSTSLSGADEIGAGESVEFTISFDSVDRSSGDVTVSAGEASTDISVTANPVPDYSQRAENDLRSRLQSLQSSDTDTEQDEELTQVSTKIEQIQTAWDSGNYERAESLYNEADQTLTSISNELDSGDDTGDSSEGGGIPIIPVAGGILAVLLILFVVLTSYVPEEGDPLYGLLGE